jgi:hypothetical protein
MNHPFRSHPELRAAVIVDGATCGSAALRHLLKGRE